MEPIISPWLIYLMGVMDSIGENFGVVLTVLIIAFMCAVGAYFFGLCVNEIKEENKSKYIKLLKKCFFWLIVAISIYSILPNGNTITKMIVAQNITPNNIQMVVKEGKTLKEGLKKDVLDIILAIKDKE